MLTRESRTDRVDMRQPIIEEDADQHRADANSVEDEQKLPAIEQEILMVH